ncbi:glycoside hydrolase superfamily [Choanephora cucurbitarum]|nr:glycoside hydrolase superfamily [Choanephora cucurbitarum]
MRSQTIGLFIPILLLFFSFAAVNASDIEKRAASKKTYGKHRLIAYVVDWELPKSVNWNLLDHVVYSFSEPDAQGNMKGFTSSSLQSFTNKAHQHNVGVSISVGGWSGSKYFSSLVRTDASRKKLAKNIVQLVSEHNLDGVNLDWEYPNDPNGMTCNQRNKKDTANYLTFIKLLRKSLDAKFTKAHKMITLAVSTRPFNDEKGHPISRLDKAWAANVDSFYIMSYDISGSWMNQAGPNAPYKASSEKYYESSVVQSIDAWHKAGISKNQLVAGMPFYGTILQTKQKVTSSTGLYVKLSNKGSIKGDKYDEYAADGCPGSTKSYSGNYQWRSVVADGIIKQQHGWKAYWDSRSMTPYAFNNKGNKVLTFDNAKSLKGKANYVKSQKLGGVMIWSLEMDDSSNTLLKSLQAVRQ